MSLRISGVEMTSAATRHRATAAPDGGWVVTWLPGRVLTRDQAVTAMALAETVATQELDAENRLWRHVDGWAAELGLSGPDAVVRASEPPPEAWPDPGDPGPMPAVVEEPETFGRVTTIVVSPRAQVRVTGDVGRTGLTGLTVETAAGESVTVALPPACVDALLEALAAATPVPFVPQLPPVHVFATRAAAAGGGGPAGGGGC